ncbi:hypothetical protein P7C73_g4329, partial [Tremellales sp. Uapishka_1]
MDPPKPSLFSSLSIGRSRSAKPSEPLTHPLLGASSSSLNLSLDTPDTARPTVSHAHSSSTSGDVGGVKAVSSLPYKPRQRHGGGGGQGSTSSITSITTSTTAAPAAATSPVTPTAGVAAPPTTSTSTSTTFALPPSATEPTFSQESPAASTMSPAGAGSSSVTSRLQLQSLKAAAQRMGLGNASMGMGMLDAIFEKSQLGRARAGEGGDWGDLLRVLMCGKAIMFLPTSPSSSLPMTPQTLRDHIAFLSPFHPLSNTGDHSSSTASIAIVVTLSGLVGTLSGTTITFESTIPSDSPMLSALRDSVLRPTALSSLRPTHIPWPTSSPPFPYFSLSADTANLPFPPLGKGNSNDIADKVPEPAKKARIY